MDEILSAYARILYLETVIPAMEARVVLLEAESAAKETSQVSPGASPQSPVLLCPEDAAFLSRGYHAREIQPDDAALLAHARDTCSKDSKPVQDERPETRVRAREPERSPTQHHHHDPIPPDHRTESSHRKRSHSPEDPPGPSRRPNHVVPKEEREFYVRHGAACLNYSRNRPCPKSPSSRQVVNSAIKKIKHFLIQQPLPHSRRQNDASVASDSQFTSSSWKPALRLTHFGCVPFNFGEPCAGTSCVNRHECLVCGEPKHPASKCPKYQGALKECCMEFNANPALCAADTCESVHRCFKCADAGHGSISCTKVKRSGGSGAGGFASSESGLVSATISRAPTPPPPVFSSPQQQHQHQQASSSRSNDEVIRFLEQQERVEPRVQLEQQQQQQQQEPPHTNAPDKSDIEISAEGEQISESEADQISEGEGDVFGLNLKFCRVFQTNKTCDRFDCGQHVCMLCGRRRHGATRCELVTSQAALASRCKF
ncbi:hypothetical protein HDU98_002231, partial [Podochytrium sp. JEL0797]